jgi:hypothetical protein
MPASLGVIYYIILPNGSETGTTSYKEALKILKGYRYRPQGAKSVLVKQVRTLMRQ